MVRATSAPARKRRKKRLFKAAKGFWGDRKNHAKLTQDAVMKSMAFNYEHRKKKKGDFRKLWIIRIGVAAKMNGISYSKMMHGLKLSGCNVNRKMLADLAITDPKSFAVFATTAKTSLGNA